MRKLCFFFAFSDCLFTDVLLYTGTMAGGDAAYIRYQEIDKFFSSGRHATVKELAAYLNDLKKAVGTEINLSAGCSEKILYKVLDKMRDELNAPLLKDSENRYYYSTPRTLTRPGYLNREETARTIRLINNLLETVRDSPVYEQAVQLCKDITAESPLIDKYGKKVKDTEHAAPNRVIFLGAPASDVRDSVWGDIYKAMENNCYITIKYITPGHTKAVSRGIRPYQLIFDNGIWDLWGYDCVNRENRLFNLSRIQSLEVRSDADRFTLPPEYDYRLHTPGTFGCFRDLSGTGPGMTTYKILFRSGSYAESFAKERIWGDNPAVEITDKGTVISFDNNQYLPILRWVLGWGADARPLQPEQLVQDWRAEIKRMRDASVSAHDTAAEGGSC